MLLWRWWVGVGRSWCVREGLVGRGLCVKVCGWWVGVGQCWFLCLGLGLVGWRWSVVGCACRYGMDGLGYVSAGLCVGAGGSVVVCA